MGSLLLQTPLALASHLSDCIAHSFLATVLQLLLCQLLVHNDKHYAGGMLLAYIRK